MMAEPARVWVPDRSWRLTPPGDPRRCRSAGQRQAHACDRPVVAELNRGRYNYREGRMRDCWWAYCAEHLYGRRLWKGRIEISITSDSPAALRGYAN